MPALLPAAHLPLGSPFASKTLMAETTVSVVSAILLLEQPIADGAG